MKAFWIVINWQHCFDQTSDCPLCMNVTFLSIIILLGCYRYAYNEVPEDEIYWLLLYCCPQKEMYLQMNFVLKMLTIALKGILKIIKLFYN